MQYICYARADQPPTTFQVSDTSLTNLVITGGTTGTFTTATAHGLQVGNPVAVSGIVSAGATNANGNFGVQTVPSTTTFTITIAASTNATYTDATMKVVTTAALSSKPIWSVQKNLYDVANFLTNLQWAGGNPSNYINICDNRAVSTGATAIFYK